MRLLLDLRGEKPPIRHDGGVEVTPEPTADGEVLAEVDGRTIYHVRLRRATREEISQTLDELTAAIENTDAGTLFGASVDDEDDDEE